MKSAEKRISRLERLLKKETATKRENHNYYKIGFTQFELSQLYKLSRVPNKSDEMLKEAMVSLQNPECKKGKKTDRLLGIILFYVSNPSAPPLVQLPVVLRYLSPVILLTGYLLTYAIYFLGFISSTYFFILIFAVFVVSVVAASILTSAYSKKIREDYVPTQQTIPGFPVNKPINRVTTAEDVIDSAKAELSLANMFYTMKNFEETKLHVERARNYLNDPLSAKSEKKQSVTEVLNKLDELMKGMQSKSKSRRTRNF